MYRIDGEGWSEVRAPVEVEGGLCNPPLVPPSPPYMAFYAASGSSPPRPEAPSPAPTPSSADAQPQEEGKKKGFAKRILSE